MQSELTTDFRERERRIERYFSAWLQKREEELPLLFDQNIAYRECGGAKFRGLPEVLAWFRECNQQGAVLRWEISSFLHDGTKTAVEWYFQGINRGETSAFYGVTLLSFNEAGKIVSAREFRSEA